MNHWKVFVLLLLHLCLVSACSGARTNLLVASQPNVNPDPSGRPSPVILKVYELRNEVAFQQASFQNLFSHPLQTLGADLLAADELVLIPGEARRIAYIPDPRTRFVGIVAGFRQMDRARWRTIQAINIEEQNYIALELSDASIIVIPSPANENWEPEKALTNTGSTQGKAENTGRPATAAKTAASGKGHENRTVPDTATDPAVKRSRLAAPQH